MEGGHEYKKGLWNAEEDRILMEYVKQHGTGKWNRIAKVTGLKRCGKSCRLRWMNYLNPNVKRGDFSEEEDDLIIRLHNLLGNRWSLIAGRLPGRTDSQVKNYWNTHLSKKLGIKKGKSKVSASPKRLANQSKDQISTSNSPSTKPKRPSNCNDEEGGGEKFVRKGFTSMHEVIMSDHDFDESTFWFANTTSEHNLPLHSLTEPYYDYFADLDWAAL